MRPFDEPSFLTPDERLAEVAGILATGILRLHTRTALSLNSQLLNGLAHEDMALAFCLWCEWFPAGMSREKQRKWYLGLSDCIVNILLQPSMEKTNSVQPIE